MAGQQSCIVIGTGDACLVKHLGDIDDDDDGADKLALEPVSSWFGLLKDSEDAVDARRERSAPVSVTTLSLLGGLVMLLGETRTGPPGKAPRRITKTPHELGYS